MIDQRVVVTGGAGFIGANFLRFMLENHPEYQIVNIDNLSSGVHTSVRELEGKPNYKFVHDSISDPLAMTRKIEEGDIVINFAAESHVDTSITNPTKVFMNNVSGVQNLLEVAKMKGVKRFVQISTDEVYGSLSISPRDPPSTEEDKVRSRNPYSASKLAGEQLALAYQNTFGLDVVVTRSSNNFGPFQFPEKVIPLFVTNLMQGRKVPLYGTGENVRDWIYVEDNCEGIWTVTEKGKAGEIYNLGGGNEVSNFDLTHKILGLMGYGEESIEYVEDRQGHDLRYALEGRKAMMLGWRPKHDFSSALESTVEWYNDNEQWWGKLKEDKDRRTS
ncbi:dTDP-glucose 4,6-dehydratase [Candidatus Pacearchaeota archaeon]|nr:dTDP-glucose 4,6-dehydratase [Candidatus Pacearchaeota archaeon]|tara:strand:+ start:708 stop:1703 length:996 start_codon:yes stop_codon:yes gene_type:complete